MIKSEHESESEGANEQFKNSMLINNPKMYYEVFVKAEKEKEAREQFEAMQKEASPREFVDAAVQLRKMGLDFDPYDKIKTPDAPDDHTSDTPTEASEDAHSALRSQDTEWLAGE